MSTAPAVEPREGAGPLSGRRPAPAADLVAPAVRPGAWLLATLLARLRHILRWLLAVGLYYTGLLAAYRRRRSRRLPQGELCVLRYHRVVPDGERETLYRLGVARRTFAAQVRLLARAGGVVDLGGAIRFLAGQDAGPGPRFLVTLDDGYRDNFTEGLPELLGAGVPGVVFVTTGPVATGERFPWERLKRIVADPGRADLRLPGGGRVRLAGGPLRRHAAFRRLHGWLKRLPEGDRRALLALWEARGRPGRATNDGPLAWDEVRALRQGGLTIGSHTLSHPDLRALADGDLREELRESRRRLEEEIGAEVRALAYPSGGHDERVVAAAREAGYDLAFTTLPGRNLPGADPRTLRRKGVGEASSELPWGGFSRALFAVELSGLYDEWLRGIFP